MDHAEAITSAAARQFGDLGDRSLREQ